MITITENAAAQIRKAAADGNMSGMSLRVAAVRNDSGEIEYGMGFDDNVADTDAVVSVGDVQVVISAACKDLLTGATLDFVEIEEGKFEFIFQNPNDPRHGVAS